MAFSGAFARPFSPPFGGGGEGNGLLNNLIAYWPGNEANGNALDLHTNALHLTDVNTVTSNPGLVYLLARQYTAATSEYHTRPGDDALLSTGDVDFTIAAWCYLDSVGASRGIVGKFGAAGFRDYHMSYSLGVNRLIFSVTDDGTTPVFAQADSVGVPSINTWYLVVGWHDAANNQLGIQANNTAANYLAHNTGVWDGTAPFRIGLTGVGTLFDGRIGPTAFWKSAPGGGGVLDSSKRDALWNGGAGLPYASFTT